jgi:hypothetical protein
VYEYTVSSEENGVVVESHGYASTMAEAIGVAESAAGEHLAVEIKKED